MFLYLDPKYPDPIFRGNGIHMITSGNGINWNLDYNQRKPIISGLHQGHYDKLYFCSHYDCHPSCFYDHNTNDYKLYLRSNVDYGVRHIQVTSSPDLHNWSPLKYISFDPEFDITSDNYYSANCMPYPNTKNTYIALIPYYKNQTKNPKESFIALAHSNDGYNWKIKSHFITPHMEPKEKITSFPAYGIIKSNDAKQYYFYEHCFRSKIVKNERPYLQRYSLRYDGFSSIYADDGYVSKNIKIPHKIYLNFHTLKDGILIIIVHDKHGKIIDRSDTINGNQSYIRSPYTINPDHYMKKGIIKIIIKKTHIYSIELEYWFFTSKID